MRLAAVLPALGTTIFAPPISTTTAFAAISFAAAALATTAVAVAAALAAR